jgi:hypothetical protein
VELTPEEEGEEEYQEGDIAREQDDHGMRVRASGDWARVEPGSNVDRHRASTAASLHKKITSGGSGGPE